VGVAPVHEVRDAKRLLGPGHRPPKLSERREGGSSLRR
jgi:hypothetical protein